jgi:mandelate racemase
MVSSYDAIPLFLTVVWCFSLLIDRRFRLVGWQGLIGMAVSGLDMAFWDAIARTLDQPIAALLGGAPIALPAYDSYGMVDPKADEKVLTPDAH